MTTLSTAAWVSHDMALAAGLGGSIFKQFALPSALSKVTDDRERAHLLARSFKKFTPIGMVSLGIIAGSWLVGRTIISGRSISKEAEILVKVKDGLVAGAVVTGIAGTLLDRELEEETDRRELGVEGMHATATSTTRSKNVFRAIQGVGMLHMACLAGALGLTTILAMKANESMKWSFLSRILP